MDKTLDGHTIKTERLDRFTVRLVRHDGTPWSPHTFSPRDSKAVLEAAVLVPATAVYYVLQVAAKLARTEAPTSARIISIARSELQ